MKGLAMSKSTFVKEGVAPSVAPVAIDAERTLTADKMLEVLVRGPVAAVPELASIIAGKGEEWIHAATGRIADSLAKLEQKRSIRPATVALWAAWAYNQLVDDASAQECVDFASAFLVGATGHIAFKQKVNAGYDQLVKELADKKAKTQDTAEYRASIKKGTTATLVRMEADLEFVTLNGVHTESDKARAEKIANAILASIKS
jgi:hypothetical protein